MKAARAWVVSDTHLGHRLMAGERPWATIEEHDAEIIARWNDCVRPNDTVWHLGDLVMNRSALPLVRQLHGRIRLVLGNHDTMRAVEYQETGLVSIHGAVVKGGDVLLTHIPVHPCQFPRFRGNVHGHMHAHVVGRPSPFFYNRQEPDPRYRCVSLEQTDYRPVLLSEVLETLPAPPTDRST